MHQREMSQDASPASAHLQPAVQQGQEGNVSKYPSLLYFCSIVSHRWTFSLVADAGGPKYAGIQRHSGQDEATDLSDIAVKIVDSACGLKLEGPPHRSPQAKQNRLGNA